MDCHNTFGPATRRKKNRFLGIMLTLMLMLITTDVRGDGPKLSCYTNLDCMNSDTFTRPYPTCSEDGYCTCKTSENITELISNNECIHYSQSFHGVVKYYCADCNTIGSTCYNKYACDFPGECNILEDEDYGYCECKVKGIPDHEMCVHYQPVSTSKQTVWLILVLIVLLIINKCISAHSFIRHRCLVPLMRKIKCCTRITNRISNEPAHGINPQSGTKTASYTISENAFMSCHRDTDLEWAIALSEQDPQPSTSQQQPSTSTVPAEERISARMRRVRLAELRPRRINARNSMTEAKHQRNASISSTISYSDPRSSSTIEDTVSQYSSTQSTPTVRRGKKFTERYYQPDSLSDNFRNVKQFRDEVIMNDILRKNLSNSLSSLSSDTSESTTVSDFESKDNSCSNSNKDIDAHNRHHHPLTLDEALRGIQCTSSSTREDDLMSNVKPVDEEASSYYSEEDQISNASEMETLDLLSKSIVHIAYVPLLFVLREKTKQFIEINY